MYNFFKYGVDLKKIELFMLLTGLSSTVRKFV